MKNDCNKTVRPYGPVKARIRKWVEALRSGKYKQIKGTLRRGELGRCCLGVACDVYAEATKQGKWERKKGHWFFTPEDQGGASAVLPSAVMAWFGLEDNNPNISIGVTTEAASSWNDGEFVTRRNFAQIADAIEATYLKRGRK